MHRGEQETNLKKSRYMENKFVWKMVAWVDIRQKQAGKLLIKFPAGDYQTDGRCEWSRARWHAHQHRSSIRQRTQDLYNTDFDRTWGVSLA